MNPEGHVFTPDQLKLVQRWLDRNDELWVRAARKAFEGDLEPLRERYELLRRDVDPR